MPISEHYSPGSCCPACAYELSGSPIGACPECGLGVTREQAVLATETGAFVREGRERWCLRWFAWPVVIAVYSIGGGVFGYLGPAGMAVIATVLTACFATSVGLGAAATRLRPPPHRAAAFEAYVRCAWATQGPWLVAPICYACALLAGLAGPEAQIVIMGFGLFAWLLGCLAAIGLGASSLSHHLRRAGLGPQPVPISECLAVAASTLVAIPVGFLAGTVAGGAAVMAMA